MASAPITSTVITKGILSDMDGTCIDSSPAVSAAWAHLKDTGYAFLDLPHILASAHGYRTIDALRKWCLITDEEKLASEVKRFEDAILHFASTGGPSGGIVQLPSVGRLLAQIEGGRPANDQGWAICTSSTHFYASRALPAARLPTPTHFITAESVNAGKPAPDPYLVGAKALGVAPEDCIVFEDAPTGIRSGKAAGCRVLAVCTSHERASLEKEEPDWIVENFDSVTAVRNEDGTITMTIAHIPSRSASSLSPLEDGGLDYSVTPDDTPLPTPVNGRSRASSPSIADGAPFGGKGLAGFSGLDGAKMDSKKSQKEEIMNVVGARDNKIDDRGAKPGLKGMQAF